MEYEKPPTATTTFSRKMTNRSHSQSFSFSANGVYDGVFASTTSTKSPLVDYGEIFRGSGPSPSSIPFLDVPELNVGKVKVDVRSSKLDYSSVFGGFRGCDFAVTPNEMIVKPERKERRNRRKGGSSSDVHLCNEVKNLTSSPEMVRMKHSDILLHQTGLKEENGTTNFTQVRSVPSPVPTEMVGDVNPLQKIGKGSENGTSHLTQVRAVPDPSPTQLVGDVSPLQKIGQGSEKGISLSGQVPVVPAPALVVDNTSLLQKVESKTPIPSIEKKLCNEGVEEVQAFRQRRSKTEVDYEKIFVRDECVKRDDSTCKTDSIAERRDVKPPPSLLQRTLNGENGASERFMGFNSGLPERFQAEDDDSPSSPPFFDAETDIDSSAAESSAALKKALEEAQVRMNIAKQMMDRKKSGFRSSAKLRSCDESPKVEGKTTEAVGSSQVEDKRDEKVVVKTEESRENSPQVLIGEVVNSSEHSFSNEGDQHAKRARKMWEVPEGALNSTSEHKREEEEEQAEVKEQEEEHARRGRKHWELPGGIFKSVMKSKQQEPEGIAPAKPESGTKQEVQPLTENPFYTFGQLGSKIKGVVEAFTGSKVLQKDETHAIEEEKSVLPQMVQCEEVDSEEMVAGIPVTETYFREVEEIQQQTESKGETKQEEKSESKMSTFAEGCSQKMEKETGWQVNCESEGGPECGVIVFQENPDPTYTFLDQEGEEEIVSGPQETFVPDDTKPFVREVQEIPTPNESLSTTQLDESVGTMVSLATENTPEPGNIHEETEHKAPRRRRVWKTSEDVYNIIRAPKVNKRHWQLPTVETETTQRSFQMEGVRIHDTNEETESTSEQATDSGLQENWTVLKQMFRQMFHTSDTTKGEDETYCLVESEKQHIDIHKKAGDENEKETSYCQITGTEGYEQNEVETEYKAYAHTIENEELESAQETNCREEEGKVEVQGKASLVREPSGEEPDVTGKDSDQESEYAREVFEEAGLAQGLSERDEIREHPDSRAEMLEYDRSETDSNKSCEKFDQMQELAEETKNNGSIDTDTSRSSFETRKGDSHNEEVGFEQDLRDQFHEKYSAASSTEEHVEEVDTDSIQSGWSVDDKIKSYVEESLAGQLQDGGASKVEEIEETKEESDDMETRLGEENNEDKTEQEHRFDSQKEEIDRNSVEPAESSGSLPKVDAKIGAATDRNMRENEGEESSRSSLEEEIDATSDASQKEAERVEKHLKKKDEAKEKERERSMVERAIREARERAFADAKERAGKAAMEKAKARVPRRVTSDGPRRSEKPPAPIEVNDKLSSAEKASMQAKLRAERAAVERALSEARERALEKALSGKFDASQTRSYGGSKSFGSSGDRRGSSSSGTENRSSVPSSSNQTAKGEPIQRCKARSERHQRTSERAAEALAEKKLRDLKVQKEEAERNRLAEALDADVKRWSNGKENNLRALLSTLQYILGAESGWKPIPLTDLVSSASVRKAYRKATLYVHPDKLQQRGASTQQKYICEKVFDLLKEAWNKFGADER